MFDLLCTLGGERVSVGNCSPAGETGDGVEILNVADAAPPWGNGRPAQGWSLGSPPPFHAEPWEPVLAAGPLELCEQDTRAGSWLARRRESPPNRAAAGGEPAFR